METKMGVISYSVSPSSLASGHSLTVTIAAVGLPVT